MSRPRLDIDCVWLTTRHGYAHIRAGDTPTARCGTDLQHGLPATLVSCLVYKVPLCGACTNGLTRNGGCTSLVALIDMAPDSGEKSRHNGMHDLLHRQAATRPATSNRSPHTTTAPTAVVVRCRWCGQLIEWMNTKSGKRLPFEHPPVPKTSVSDEEQPWAPGVWSTGRGNRTVMAPLNHYGRDRRERTQHVVLVHQCPKRPPPDAT